MPNELGGRLGPSVDWASMTPEWVIVGSRWSGPGVAVFASKELTGAQLDYRVRKYTYQSFHEMARSFAKDVERTLYVYFHDYVIVFGPDYPSVLRALLEQWSPVDAPLAIEGIVEGEVMDDE